MRHNLDIDRYKSKPENYIQEELVQNITAGALVKLIHDIFYREDFKVYTDVLNKHSSKLEIGIDYELYEADEVSTFDSQKLCYRKVLFHANQPQVYIDYWVYGDVITSDMLHELDDRLKTAENDIDRAEEAIDVLDTRLTTAESDIDTVESNIASLDTRLTTAENDINTVEENLGTVASSLAEVIDSKAKPGGFAGLDDQGQLLGTSMPTGFIPDAIVETVDFAALPTEGKEKTLYITLNDDQIYRWDSTKGKYIPLSSAGGEGGVGGGIFPSGSFFAFEVGSDGYLYVVYPEGGSVPDFDVDDEGYLWVIFELEDEDVIDI